MISIRLPGPVITALKTEAAKRETTVSDILRDLVEEELKNRGYSLSEEPIEGQMQI